MKRTLCFFILMFSTCGCIFYGGTSSLVLNAEVWQHWKSGKPIVLTQDFTVVHTFGPLKDKNRCFSKSFDGMIPTNLLETCYVLPKGTKIYVKEEQKKKDFIEIILPIFPAICGKKSYIIMVSKGNLIYLRCCKMEVCESYERRKETK